MLNRIEIRNFQSLVHVDLDLAPLTVIVGPSSSGKSAFIRSMRALHENRRGTAFITHGERVASISAHLEQGIVTLTRSTQTAPNHYTVIPSDPAHPLYPKAEFSKLGGDVPSEVSEFLGIAPDEVPLSIASQFDKPYLLDTSAAEVARILGSLTNAHIILEGARESNRRKLASSQTLKTRSADLEAIRARIPEFQALKAQREALDRAEQLIARARTVQERIESITRHIDTIEIAESRLPALRAQLAALPDLPSIDALITRYEDARRRQSAFMRAIQLVSSSSREAEQARAQLVDAQTAFDQARADLQSGMKGIAQGFERYFRERGTLHTTTAPDDLIAVGEASTLAARYVATLEA
jgi:DNA repair ATPase RecN